MIDDEKLDVVDLNDEPTGRTVRLSVSHRASTPHRVAAVLVFRPDSKLLVQVHKYHDRKLDHSVGGHVMAGESYEVAAKREMKEELDLEVPITKIAEGLVSEEHYPEQGFDLVHLFGVFTAQAPAGWEAVETEEVDRLLEMSVDEIVDAMNKDPNKFLQGFIVSLSAYLNYIGSDLKIKAYGKK